VSPLKYRLAALPICVLDRLGLVPQPRVPVSYVVERANWSIKWDGTYICRGIEQIIRGLIELSDRPERLANRLIHFGSQFQWVAWADALPKSNRFVATYFHGKPEDSPDMARHVEQFIASLPQLECVVTAARLVEQRLLSWGVPRSKLVRIPIGVDLDLFRPATAAERHEARAHYGISDDQLVIGSFQKDGIGWDEGLEPKMIKGPDILIETVARVMQNRSVFVLLTGPARGFVKRGLNRLGVPFAHDYVSDYRALMNRYAALDIYINPSREEGGPKGIIEAMAAGVPVVTSAVGMAPELVRPDETGQLVPPDDPDALAAAILEIDARPDIRTRIVSTARAAVDCCNWQNVAKRHYEEVYRPLMTMRS
jgi:glycosyltransferase involved in cell wall biosynthesis